RAVAALEARLGVRLLHRTTRSVTLTDDGERYLERARRAVAEFEALEAQENDRAPLTGRLSVTAPVLFGQLHVLPVVREFLGAHGAIEVRLTLLDRVVSLAEEGIDLGVRIGALPDSSLRARRIAQVRSVLCASPAYLRRMGVPRSLEALSKHACIAFTGTTPIADRWSFPGPGKRERTIVVRPRLIVNSGQAAIDAAVAGMGITRVVSYQIASLVAARKLAIVLPSFERQAVPVHIVSLPGAQSRAAIAFGELASQRIRERLTWRAS
ncbi:MAG TPA: LysR family transcriptional regulator, partial [Polyangiaceae bacterium]|nr:LysR family transcriptional regulator [Polyangiaceae bacterium]